jgi:hypothetical protein
MPLLHICSPLPPGSSSMQQSKMGWVLTIHWKFMLYFTLSIWWSWHCKVQLMCNLALFTLVKLESTHPSHPQLSSSVQSLKFQWDVADTSINTPKHSSLSSYSHSHTCSSVMVHYINISGENGISILAVCTYIKILEVWACISQGNPPHSKVSKCKHRIPILVCLPEFYLWHLQVAPVISKLSGYCPHSRR